MCRSPVPVEGFTCTATPSQDLNYVTSAGHIIIHLIYDKHKTKICMCILSPRFTPENPTAKAVCSGKTTKVWELVSSNKNTLRFLEFFSETNLLLKVSEMYSSDKKRTKKEKSHVTKTKNDRSYIKNAEVLLQKKHCLDRHYTTLHQRSSTVEKTNYVKHMESTSISYTKVLQMEHRTISIPVISLSSVHMADFYLSAQSQHCCSRHSIQKWPLYFLKTRVLANLRS